MGEKARKFAIGDRTYINWCGAPVEVVGYDDDRILARYSGGRLAGLQGVPSSIGSYEESELGERSAE